MDIIRIIWDGLPGWWASPDSSPVLVGLWIILYLYFMVRWMVRTTRGMARIESGQSADAITRVGWHFVPFIIMQNGVIFGALVARKVGLEGGMLGLGHSGSAPVLILTIPLVSWIVMHKVSRQILEFRLGPGFHAHHPTRAEQRTNWLFPLFTAMALGYSYATGMAGYHFAVMAWGLLFAFNIYMYVPGTGSAYGRRPKLVSSLKAHNKDEGPLRGTPLESDLMALAKHAGYTPASMVQTYNIAGSMREGSTTDPDEWRRNLGLLIWQFSALLGWNGAQPKVLLPLLRILSPEGYLAYQSVPIAGQRMSRIRLRADRIPGFGAFRDFWDGLPSSVMIGSLMAGLMVGFFFAQQYFVTGPMSQGSGRLPIIPMILVAAIPAASLSLVQYLHSPGRKGFVYGYQEWKRLTPEVRDLPDAEAVAQFLGHLAGVEALSMDIRRPEVMAMIILSQKRTQRLLQTLSLTSQEISHSTIERIVADTLQNAAVEAEKQSKAAAHGD